MPPLNLIKRSEVAQPIDAATFDLNLTLIETSVNGKADTTDPRLSDPRVPVAHQHLNADLPELVAALAAKASAGSVASLADQVDNLADAVAAVPNVPGVHTGTGHPSDAVGIDGAMYFDTTPGGLVLYGPKGQSPAAPGHWPATGTVLLAPGDGSIVFMTAAGLQAAALAGTLSSAATYRVAGTDESAIVLVDTIVPNLVQISSPTKATRFMVDEIHGGVLSSSNPQFSIILEGMDL